MPTTLDVTGLTAEQIEELQRTIDAMRVPSQAKKMNDEEWIRELKAWGRSRPPVHSFVDTSRDSIYEGRGE